VNILIESLVEEINSVENKPAKAEEKES